MLRPRIIPCLLVQNNGLVKTVGFKSPKYVGDPINAVKIFNEKEADELIVLDIDATAQGTAPNFQMIAHLAAECQMPLCYGGGIKSVEHAKQIIGLGVEKVAISSAAVADPHLLTRISEAIGRQSVVAVLDVRKKTGIFSSGYEITTHNGKIAHKLNLIDFVKEIEHAGAGEIVINSVNLDGNMQGYDLNLAKEIRAAVNVPLTFLGGAGSHSHIQELFSTCGIVGAAAGSLFVFKGQYRAVLINYPSQAQKDAIAQLLPPA